MKRTKWIRQTTRSRTVGETKLNGLRKNGTLPPIKAATPHEKPFTEQGSDRLPPSPTVTNRERPSRASENDHTNPTVHELVPVEDEAAAADRNANERHKQYLQTIREFGLSFREALFAEEYVRTLNLSHSARFAGTPEKSASVAAQHMIARDRVQRYITWLAEERIKQTNIGQDDVLIELARLAFASPRTLLRPDGTAKTLAEMTSAEAACIRSVRVTQHFEAKTGRVAAITHRYDLWNKLDALQLLGRHLGMFHTKISVEHTKRIELRAEIDRVKGNLGRDELETVLGILAAATGQANASEGVHTRLLSSE